MVLRASARGRTVRGRRPDAPRVQQKPGVLTCQCHTVITGQTAQQMLEQHISEAARSASPCHVEIY